MHFVLVSKGQNIEIKTQAQTNIQLALHSQDSAVITYQVYKIMGISNVLFI